MIATEDDPRFDREAAKLRLWVRLGLAFVVGGLVAVFTIAVMLNPYKDGRVWFQETHTQMGLPPCTFKVLTGLPCPSCGMTSSFTLLVHGDLWNSARANFVGTLLALFCLAVIPWGLVSAVRGRWLLVRSLEFILVRLVLAFVVLLLLRWGFVVASILLFGEAGNEQARQPHGRFPALVTSSPARDDVRHRLHEPGQSGDDGIAFRGRQETSRGAA